MFVVFRCDCGKFLYCKDFLKSHECAYCGKVLRVGGRRVLCRSEIVDILDGMSVEERDAFEFEVNKLNTVVLKDLVNLFDVNINYGK